MVLGQGLGCRTQGSRFKARVLGSGAQGRGFRVQSIDFRALR